MQSLFAVLDAGTVEALYVFAIAGMVIALALICSGVMARRKDHQASHFYFIAGGISGGVALVLVLLAVVFGEGSR
jgi:hypothetical protein